MMQCKTGAWMNTFDADDKTAYQRWSSEKPRTAVEVHRVFVGAGFTGGLTSTKDHLRGRCCCSRAQIRAVGGLA